MESNISFCSIEVLIIIIIIIILNFVVLTILFSTFKYVFLINLYDNLIFKKSCNAFELNKL